ncbi:MAG: DUF502 domain-containing protein [Opitutaceae bacterium]|nr:DUF502 domain-containing protein [Cephaloticoccus sp.]MCP5530110.1 DUF502 domain-containing protein [Opitutaceae bacterium]
MSNHDDSKLITFRNAFITGLVLLAPLVVTVWALRKIIEVVGGSVSPVFIYFLPEFLRDRPSLGLLWDVIATVIVLLLVTVLGYVSRHVFGKYLLSVGERIMLGIPGVSAVYNTVKQIVDTFGSQKRNIFSKVVLIEFPRKGAWVIGFLTSKAKGEAQAKTQQDVWTVFVPTTPNPTSGFLVLVPRQDIVELDMSVGDGMKLIISGGGVVPPWPGPAAALPEEQPTAN